MANIRNYISLQDRMTPVFRSILKSMDSTMRMMRNLDKQANNGVQSKAFKAAERDIKRANNELIKMQNNLSKVDKEANKAAASTGKIAENASRISISGFLTGLASAFYLAKKIADTMSGIMEVPDTMNAQAYRLETYDNSSATGDQLLDMAYGAAQNSRSDVNATADLASRILISGATDGNGAQAIEMARLLNKASFLGGSSSRESQRALLQLSQGLASGALQGDELRAIREQAPGLTDVLARGLSSLGEKGLLPKKFIDTSIGDLKKLGAEGELTSDRIMAAFSEMRDYIDTTFEKSPKTFSQAWTGIVNVWKRWLKFMSRGDHALARINNKVWDLLEWFESDAGAKFFSDLATVVDIATNCIIQIVDWISQAVNWFQELDNKSEILTSSLMALGIAFLAAAAAGVASFIAANWWILLAVAGVGALIYTLLDLGITAQQIAGGIVGGIRFVISAVWDFITLVIAGLGVIIAAIWDAILFIGIVLIGMGTTIVSVGSSIITIVVQLIMWAILAIWSIIVTAVNVIYTIFKTIDGVIRLIVAGIVKVFGKMVKGILEGIQKIAEALDAVFGTNLAGGIGGWIEGLDDSVKKVVDAIGPLESFEDIKNQWKDSYKTLGDMWAGKGEYDDWNLFDNLTENWDSIWDVGDKLAQPLMDLMEDPREAWGLVDWSYEQFENPFDSWEEGKKWGEDFVNDLESKLEKYEKFNPENIEEYLSKFDTDGLRVNGGSIDSIKSDVDISDEDLQLLRDIAARDFLVTLQTRAPQVHNTFGDIKETADVNKILEVIQDMVDEQLATSLVVE